MVTYEKEEKQAILEEYKINRQRDRAFVLIKISSIKNSNARICAIY